MVLLICPAKARAAEFKAESTQAFEQCSYWRFEERDRGVYIECEAISRTRDVPAGLAWLISPIIRNLPRESLVFTPAVTRHRSPGLIKPGIAINSDKKTKKACTPI